MTESASEKKKTMQNQAENTEGTPSRIASVKAAEQYLPGMQPKLVKPFRFSTQPYEYKVVALRECPPAGSHAGLRYAPTRRRLLAAAHRG
jgi:hypothetical protein